MDRGLHTYSLRIREILSKNVAIATYSANHFFRAMWSDAIRADTGTPLMPQRNNHQRKRWLHATAWLLASSPLLAVATPPPAPSRDWRDEIIYFVMTDRFADGDAGNNDQGTGEYDPADEAKYNGGDLVGLRRHLDYIQQLGATALWITPPVLNQWWHAGSRYGGYHGYWASDFSRIDPHLGTVADYQALADDLHARDMKLVQDVVVNHVGNWLQYGSEWRASDPARSASLEVDGQGALAPSQAPFDANDPRDARQRELGIYHWTPSVRDFRDRHQSENWQLSGLDDLNTENPLVRRALRESYGRWIRDIGVDAFRVDTAIHVPAGFFEDFMYSEDPEAPGMAKVAASRGIPDFLAFGEGFTIDRPYDNAGAKLLETYAGPRGLHSMINFPLYGTLGDVFARGHATAELAWRIDGMMRTHRDPWRMPTFIDNHDVDRFLAGSDVTGQRQALFAMLSLPGIPVIYYGTEQAMHERRPAMFANGQGAGGRDHWDAASQGYRWLREAIAIRRTHPALRRAHPRLLASNAAGPGGIAWRMESDEEDLVVLLNTATHPALLDASMLPKDKHLQPFYSIRADQDPDALRFVEQQVWLPPRSGFLARVERGRGDTRRAGAPSIDALPANPLRGDTQVGGQAIPGDCVQLVVDGAAAGDCALADDGGRWAARLNVSEMIDPSITHRLTVWVPKTGAIASAQTFKVQREWRLAGELRDPANDDHGLDGRYRYPTGDGWPGHHPADLLGVRAFTSGGALKIELSMQEISTTWNPANGFDHVAFDVYIDLPGNQSEGQSLMPRQHARLPDDMRWDVHARVGGWSNAAFRATGSSAVQDGEALTRAPRIEVDADARTITLTFDAGMLGGYPDLAGSRLHVTTWDMDGEYRPLQPEAGANAFGGGDATSPRIMDAVGPLLLR